MRLRKMRFKRLVAPPRSRAFTDERRPGPAGTIAPLIPINVRTAAMVDAARVMETTTTAMPDHVTLLDELREQYEAARASPHEHADVPGFQEIDARLRKAFRWLEKVVTYLDGLHLPINHRFDLGHGIVFGPARFKRGFVGQHVQRIVGFPVLDEINITYQIQALAPPAIEVAAGGAALVETILDDAGVRYTARHIEDAAGNVNKCAITVASEIPADISFRADYRTGIVRISFINVDRFDRVSLAFDSRSIDEPMLEDLVRFILGRGDNLLHRAPLVGVHGKPFG